MRLVREPRVVRRRHSPETVVGHAYGTSTYGNSHRVLCERRSVAWSVLGGDSRIQASARTRRSVVENVWNRKALASVGIWETSQPSPPAPADAEDYFEQAYEADEFGVHVPEYLAVR